MVTIFLFPIFYCLSRTFPTDLWKRKRESSLYEEQMVEMGLRHFPLNFIRHPLPLRKRSPKLTKLSKFFVWPMAFDSTKEMSWRCKTSNIFSHPIFIFSPFDSHLISPFPLLCLFPIYFPILNYYILLITFLF